MNRMVLGSVCILLLGAAGCGGSEPSPKAPEPPPASTATQPTVTMSGTTTATPGQETRQGSSTLAASTAATSGVQTPPPSGNRGVTGKGPAAGSSTSNAPMKLTDDQILYVLHAANLAEMEQARIAEKKAKDGRVKRFAVMMIKDHADADFRTSDVAKRTNASLAPSDISNRMESDAKENTVAINAEKGGKDFDRKYMEGQVKEHRAVLDAIDRDLLPSVTSTEVRELLQTVRPKIETHLHEAQDIMNGFSERRGTAAPSGDTQ